MPRRVSGTPLPSQSLLLLAAAGAMAIVAAALVSPVIRMLRGYGMIRQPGGRGSHASPTPVGGGLAFTLPVSAAWIAVAATEGDAVVMTIAIAGLLVTATGFLDDRIGLRARTRLAVQGAAAVAVAAAEFGAMPVGSPAAPLIVLCPVVIVWCTNLTNFMDGIDGLAASEGLFIAAAGSVLWTWQGGEPAVGLCLACAAGALVGFVPWNAPPARVFMGDAGSTWLGFTMSALALHACWLRPGTWAAWAVLPALFVSDATLCLMRRAIRREDLATGHRAHAYQNLARLTGSHGAVVLLFAACNTALLVAAGAALHNPGLGGPIAAVTYAIAGSAMALARSGVHGIADPRPSDRLPPTQIR
ncbi:MAG: glycosyl transferase [Planctomycetes bacterium]|nr:glycosyl transferase [Planctomycetota bacterium]